MGPYEKHLGKTPSRYVATQQAERIEKIARYVLFVDSKGRKLKYSENLNFQVNVLVVLGPAEIEDSLLEKAIWCEIGLGMTGPYRRAEYKRSSGKLKIISYRRRAFIPPKAALNTCLQSIEKVLLIHAHKIRSRWDSDYTEIRRRIKRRVRKSTYKKGVYFHIALQDEDLLKTMLRSEFLRNQAPREAPSWQKKDTTLQWRLNRRVEKISRLLGVYGEQHFTREWVKKWSPWSKKNWQLARFLDWFPEINYPEHHLYYFIKGMKGKPGEELFLYLLEYLKIDTSKVDWWGSLIEQKNVPVFSKNAYIFCPSRHHQSAQGKFRNGRRRRDSNGKVIYDRFTVEFIPVEDTPRQAPEQVLEPCEEEEDIPF